MCPPITPLKSSLSIFLPSKLPLPSNARANTSDAVIANSTFLFLANKIFSDEPPVISIFAETFGSFLFMISDIAVPIIEKAPPALEVAIEIYLTPAAYVVIPNTNNNIKLPMTFEILKFFIKYLHFLFYNITVITLL